MDESYFKNWNDITFDFFDLASITFKSRGIDLEDYRIYGNAEIIEKWNRDNTRNRD